MPLVAMVIEQTACGERSFDICSRLMDDRVIFYPGLGIYDTMQSFEPDIRTICYDIAMSMGSLLLAGGAEGKRMALPNSRILINQSSGGFEGQSTDVEIHAKELALRARVGEIYAMHTSQTVERFHADMERDRYLTGEEA